MKKLLTILSLPILTGLLGLFILSSLPAPAIALALSYPETPDSTEYYSPDYIRYSDYTYNKNIKSIELYKVGFELSDAVIQLNTDDRLQLEFDDLEGNIRQYYYSVTHCDATWHPTNMVEQYDFSFNTRQSYTHYKVAFPNKRMSMKLSGNYLLRVYTKSEEGEEVLAITKRFMVFDPKVTLEATVQRASTIEENETHQEVDFAIHTNGYRIDAPYQDIQVSILQNGRWDNALTSLKPYMVKGDILDYSFDNGSNQFAGGNEFRHFDIKSLKYLSDKVKEISYGEGEFQVKLWESERRTFKVYIQDDDINGKFLLKTEDEPSVETMGEYVAVNFFLPYSAPILHGNLYVAGAFNGWQYMPENKMKYAYNRHGYEATIRFKQGYYNYLYVLLPNNASKGDETFIEGSHFETGNTYLILVYHHDRGTLYDQLIAVGNFDSRK
jgi:hypothetical protein